LADTESKVSGLKEALNIKMVEVNIKKEKRAFIDK